MKIKATPADKIFDVFVYIFLALMIVITLYPLIYVMSMSISDPIQVATGKVYLLPKGFSWLSMGKVLGDSSILMYYKNTLFYTVVGTVMGLIVTSLAAYPLSRKEFAYRGVFGKIITFTMFFSGGLIPTYIVVAKYLHLYNSRWAILLLPLANAWYILVTKAFFESLPGEIIESARIDGASEYRIFGQLVIPLSKPILAVMALYYAIAHWNSYFSEMLYLGDKKLWPLSIYIQQTVVKAANTANAGSLFSQLTTEELLSSLQMKYAVIVVAVLPMLLIYPLISKNLEKGLMIGAIKG